MKNLYTKTPDKNDFNFLENYYYKSIYFFMLQQVTETRTCQLVSYSLLR
jgi:hypothetical protein